MKQAASVSGLPSVPGSRMAILQSKWYREHTDMLVKKCIDTLQLSGCASIDHHVLPGSLEMPIAAQTLARNRKNAPLDAIICIGAVLKGDTYHFEMVMSECARGLGTVSLAESIPILVEVLPVLSLEQLAERCRDDEFNKGIEAAVAAIEIVHWIRSVTTKS